MKRYCTSCGSPTDYSLKKPQFCCNCGKSFDNNQTVQDKPVIANNTINRARPNLNQKLRNFKNIENDDHENYDDDNDDYDNNVNHVPNINGLEVETFAEKTRGEKIGDLMKSPSKPNKRSPSKTKAQKRKFLKISKKKLDLSEDQSNEQKEG
jgi:hypothetical protein